MSRKIHIILKDINNYSNLFVQFNVKVSFRKGYYNRISFELMLGRSTVFYVLFAVITQDENFILNLFAASLSHDYFTPTFAAIHK